MKTLKVNGWSRELLELVPEPLREQVYRNRPAVALITNEMWIVESDGEPIFVFGAANLNFITDRTYVWMVPLSGFSSRHVRASVRLFRQWAVGKRELIATCFDTRSKRFAVLFGFREVEPTLFAREI